jgi:TolA-binding protein
MATGRQTFSGTTSAVIFDAILNREPVAPIELNADVPPDLERIIAKAIDKDRRLRYQSASEMRTDLQRLKRSRESSRIATPAIAGTASGTRRPTSDMAVAPVSAAVEHASAAGSTQMRPSRWTMLFAGVGAICFLGAGVLLVYSRSVPPPPPVESDRPTGQPAFGPSSASAGSATVAPATLPPPAASPSTPAAMPVPPASLDNSKSAAQQGTSRTTSALESTVPGGRGVDPAVERLRIARSKFDAKLYDQALVDLKAIAVEHPGSSSAPEIHLLMAGTYERQGRIDDALAAYVELRDRHRSSNAAAEGTFAMANLLLRSKRGDRERAAQDLFTDVAASYPKSPFAPRALVAKGALEDRARTRVVDPVLKTSVPSALISYRTLVERYPNADTAEGALWQLSEMYEDLNRFDLAAQALDNLASRFPNNKRDAQWRAAELYDRKLRDSASAKAAYARVPRSSPHYNDAQKRAAR